MCSASCTSTCPRSWRGYLAFIVAGAASVGYLVTRRPGWDRCAAAAAEVGVLFGALMIVSGSIWGRPTWGVWWTWDARLTSTAVLLLTWVAYLLLRAMVEEPRRAGALRRRGRHPRVGADPDRPPLRALVAHAAPAVHDPRTRPARPSTARSCCRSPLNAVAFTLLFAYFLARRMEIARLEDEALSPEDAR